MERFWKEERLWIYRFDGLEEEDPVDKAVLIGIHNVLGVKLEACKAIDKNSEDGGQEVKERWNGSRGCPHEEDVCQEP